MTQPIRTFARRIVTAHPSDAQADAFPSANAVRRRIRATIVLMQLAIFAMRVLEVMFFVGLVGSSVVVLISFVEDGKELFGKDE